MKRKNAIGYVRSAVNDPSDETIKRMEMEIRAYCERQKLDLKKVFVDNGASGSNFNRDGWRRMRGYLEEEKGKIHHLVVPNLDRISRDYNLFHLEVKNLKQNFGLKIKPAYVNKVSIDLFLFSPVKPRSGRKKIKR